MTAQKGDLETNHDTEESAEHNAVAEDELPEPEQPQSKTADYLKFFGLIAFLVILSLISIYAVRFIGSLDDTENAVEQLTAAIRDAGAWGVLICLGLQFLHIVVAVIPGEIVQAAIGYVYGTLFGGLIVLTGALITSIFLFYLVRWLGAPFVQNMIGKKEGRLVAAFQRFVSDSKRLNAAVFIIFLIPGMPKDIFTYLFPLTPIRPEEFFVLSTIARAPAVFATTFVVDAFNKGNYLACAIVAVIFGGLGIIGILFNMKIIELVDKLVEKFHTITDKK